MTGRSTPAKNGQTKDADLLAGLMFESEPERISTARKGREPNPMNPAVVLALNAMLTGKLPSGDDAPPALIKFGAKWSGTNKDLRTDLLSTVNKWHKTVDPEGITVKISFDTVEGKRSVDSDDNDKAVVIRYKARKATDEEITKAKARKDKALASTSAS